MNGEPRQSWFVVILSGKRLGRIPFLAYARDKDDAEKRAWFWLRSRAFRWYVIETLTLEEYSKTAIKPLGHLIDELEKVPLQ